MISRRDLLKSAVIAVLGAGLGEGCAVRGSAHTAQPPDQGKRNFAKVDISRDRINRTVAGLRPFRPSGFVVKTENLGNKTIIHNYGHGGSGITLSWGTAHMAVEEALAADEAGYAVIGCGCVGLATARLLQKQGFEVTIYAKDLPPDTTSDVAGAIWYPSQIAGFGRQTPEFINRLTRAARLSHRYFKNIVGDYYGVRWIENYCFSKTPQETIGYWPTLQDLYPDYKELRKEDHPFDFPYAYRFTTLLIETPIYMNALLHDFLSAGGNIVVKEFGNPEDIFALQESVVMNCTGIGAKSLFNDEELMPIKGQLTILSPQPEIDYIAATGGLYMIPRKDGILLGSTYEWDDWSLEPDEEATQRIMSGHIKFFDGMNGQHTG